MENAVYGNAKDLQSTINGTLRAFGIKRFDLESPGAPRAYRAVVKGDLLYIKAHNVNQARSMAVKAGYVVLSIARWED